MPKSFICLTTFDLIDFAVIGLAKKLPPFVKIA
nr:MAG TPA: hypothetical protein [Caudoviricetes sp.]